MRAVHHLAHRLTEVLYDTVAHESSAGRRILLQLAPMHIRCARTHTVAHSHLLHDAKEVVTRMMVATNNDLKQVVDEMVAQSSEFWQGQVRGARHS